MLIYLLSMILTIHLVASSSNKKIVSLFESFLLSKEFFTVCLLLFRKIQNTFIIMVINMFGQGLCWSLKMELMDIAGLLVIINKQKSTP